LETRAIVHLSVACLAPLLAACGASDSPGFEGGTVTSWAAYGATPGGTHYSPATQITPENVKWLKPAWEHNSGDIRYARGPGEDGLPQTASGFQASSRTTH